LTTADARQPFARLRTHAYYRHTPENVVVRVPGTDRTGAHEHPAALVGIEERRAQHLAAHHRGSPGLRRVDLRVGLLSARLCREPRLDCLRGQDRKLSL